jgi:hypothetical protein
VFLECSSGADIWTLWKELSESMVRRSEEFVTGFTSRGARKAKRRDIYTELLFPSKAK